MVSVAEFIEACVCPYCFVRNEKGYVEWDSRGRAEHRRFDTRRRLIRHLRKQHPNSLAAKHEAEA